MLALKKQPNKNVQHAKCGTNFGGLFCPYQGLDRILPYENRDYFVFRCEQKTDRMAFFAPRPPTPASNKVNF